MKSKIGILGGSFDPIHNGHIAIARLALQELHLTKILFVPTKQNPLKQTVTTSYHHRKKMVELVLEDNMELYDNDSIYAIDLVTDIKGSYPDSDLYFIMGSDSVSTLEKWKKIDSLATLVHFIGITRDNQKVTSDYPVHYLSLAETASSTVVRNGDFRDLDAKVRKYIFDHHLYLEAIVASRVDEKRFVHTLGVVEKAKELCLSHHKDQQFIADMYLASLLHDICKCDSDDVLRVTMQKHFSDKLDTPSAVWHAYVGSYYVKHYLCLDNDRVINAIYNHTIIEDYNDFNLILKLADNLEVNRKVIFKDVELLAHINLSDAYHLLQSKFK